VQKYVMAVDKDGKPLGFLKTTLMGAVLVVVPIGIIGFALWQITSLFRSLLLPVVEKLPFDSIFLRYSVIAMALLAVFLLCYFTGVAVRTRWGSAMRGWIERFLLERIPGYSMIRTLIHQYLGHEEERQFRPVLVDLYGSDSRAVGFEIEELADGKVAVFLPSVPAATIGQVQLVPRERVHPLQASMHATLESLTMFGVGSSKLVGRDPGDGPGVEEQ
jgi:uncharacterized membrane protein